MYCRSVCIWRAANANAANWFCDSVVVWVWFARIGRATVGSYPTCKHTTVEQPPQVIVCLLYKQDKTPGEGRRPISSALQMSPQKLCAERLLSFHFTDSQ